MDRLLVIEPKELIFKFELGQASSATMELRNVMYTMPVAFQVQPTAADKYTVKPACGIIPPLGKVQVDVGMKAQEVLKGAIPWTDDKFLVQSVVVPGGKGDNQGAVKLEWFTANKKQVFCDSGVQAMVVGGVVIRKLVEEGSMEGVRAVLEVDQKVADLQDENGRTAMHVAVDSGRAELVQVLLEFGAEIEGGGNYSKTALQLAAELGETLIVELLLAKGAELRTALHLAAAGGHVGVVEVLLEAGSGVNATNLEDGHTPLHAAAGSGKPGCLHCLQLLLLAGADVHAKTTTSYTPLHLAAARGDVDMSRVLVDAGSNIDAKTSPPSCFTPFDLALPLNKGPLLDFLRLGDDMRFSASHGQLLDLQQCIQAGASPKGHDQYGWTALHRAAFKGHTDIVKFLLDARTANIHSLDDDGYTPLHCAIEAGHKEITRLLLLHGADPNAPIGNNSHVMPLQFARVFHHESIAQLLLDWGATTHDSQALITSFEFSPLVEEIMQHPPSHRKPSKLHKNLQVWPQSTMVS